MYTCREGATQAAEGLKAKASAQQYSTIGATSFIYLLTARSSEVKALIK